MFFFKFLILYIPFLKILRCGNYWVDNTVVTSGTGIQSSPFKSLSEAITKSGNNGLIYLKGSQSIIDLVGTITISKNLTILTDNEIDPLAKPSVLMFSSDLNFVIECYNKLILQYIVFARGPNQGVPYLFDVKMMASLTTNQIIFVNFYPDTTLIGIIFCSKGKITMNYTQIQKFNQLKELPNLLYIVSLDSGSSIEIFFFQFTYSEIKGSIFLADKSLISISNSEFSNLNFPDETLQGGNIITTNKDATLLNVKIFDCKTKTKSMFMIVPSSELNVNFMIQMAELKNITQSDMTITSANPLILSVNGAQLSKIVIAGAIIAINQGVSSLISVQNTYGIFVLNTVTFMNNFASDVIYTNYLMYFEAKTLECSKNNVLLDYVYPLGGSCLNLRNIIAILMDIITIADCKSLNTTAGIKLYVDDSLLPALQNFKEVPPGCQITNFIFSNNYANYNILNEIGAAIFIDSIFGVKLDQGKFLGNVIDAPDSVKDRTGGSCINSINLKNILSVNNTIFKGNKAKYFSNCLQFQGTLLAVVLSIFDSNIGLAPPDQINTESIGGAIYVISENVTIAHTIFKGNRAYFAGCIYINMNNQKNYLNFLGVNLTFIQNYADNTGGAILFDADIMSAEISIVYSGFVGNSASDYGGAISTKFASLTTSLTFGYDLFTQNQAQFGGVMDLEHVIGTVIVAYSNLTKNLASNSFGVGSGGAIYVYGRSTSYVILKSTRIFENVAQFRGGGLFCLSGNVTHVNMSYYNNQAFEGGSLYGTVYSLHFVYGASFYNETTKGYGGAIVVKEYSVLVLYWTNFTRCNSTLRGGALMMIDETYLVIVESYFIENHSNSGSALYSIEIMVRQIFINSSFFINNTGSDTVVGGMYTTLIMILTLIKDNSIKAISYTKKSNLTIGGCQLLNQKCASTSKGCFITLSLNSIIQISQTLVKGVYSQSEGGFIYLESSNLTLGYSYVYEVSATKGACIEGTKYSNILIAMTDFQYYSPDCLYFSDAQNVTLMGVNITNPIFQKMKLLNSFLEGGPALSLINSPLIYMYGCVIKNNIGITNDGAAVFIQMDDHNSIMSHIIGCAFLNNSAFLKGGAIYIYNQNITLLKNTFMYNTAQSGGAIYFDSYEADYSINVLKMNTFGYNTATLEGGCFKYVEIEPIFSDNIFIPNSNTAVYGPLYAAYPIRMKMKVLEPSGSDPNLAKMNHSYNQIYDSLDNIDRCAELVNEQSGQVFSKVLEFYLLDPYDQIITTIQDGTASVQLKNLSNPSMTCENYGWCTCMLSDEKRDCSHFKYVNLELADAVNSTGGVNLTNISYNLVGETSVPVKDGKFTFDSLTLYANPGTNWTLNFTNRLINNFYSNFFSPNFFERNSKNSYEYYVNIFIRTCIRGEIYDNIINTCFSCPPGKFSLSPTEKECQDCPANAVCNGGDQIIVDKGFWRSSVNSTHIHECKYTPEACLGGYESSCVHGHVGPLCSSCDIYGPIKYTKDVGNVCSTCIGDAENIVKILFIGFALAVLLVWVIRSSIYVGEGEQINFRSIYFKLFLNYVQVTTLANGLEIDWPRLVQYILNIQVNMGNVTRFISLDCLFADNDENISVIYAKVLLYSILPFFIVICVVSFWLLIYLFRKTPKKNELIASLIISLFFIHPSLINILTSTVSCTEIDPGKYYITSNLNYECSTDEHNAWSFGLMYPSLVIWVGFFPLGCLYYLRRNSTSLNDVVVKKKLGFLYTGFKQNHYYWEFVVMLRKFSLIMVTSFWDSSVNVRALIVLLILAISIYLQISKKPYRSADLNELEFRSTLVSLLTIYLGLLYMVTTEIQYEALIFILIIGINLYFLLFWASRMLVSYSNSKIFIFFPRIQRYLLKLKTEFQQLDNNRKSLFDFDEQEEQLKKGLSSKLSKKITGKIAAKPMTKEFSQTSKEESEKTSKANIDNINSTNRDLKIKESSKVNNFISNFNATEASRNNKSNIPNINDGSINDDKSNVHESKKMEHDVMKFE